MDKILNIIEIIAFGDSKSQTEKIVVTALIQDYFINLNPFDYIFQLSDIYTNEFTSDKSKNTSNIIKYKHIIVSDIHTTDVMQDLNRSGSIHYVDDNTLENTLIRIMDDDEYPILVLLNKKSNSDFNLYCQLFEFLSNDITFITVNNTTINHSEGFDSQSILDKKMNVLSSPMFDAPSYMDTLKLYEYKGKNIYKCENFVYEQTFYKDFENYKVFAVEDVKLTRWCNNIDTADIKENFDFEIFNILSYEYFDLDYHLQYFGTESGIEFKRIFNEDDNTKLIEDYMNMDINSLKKINHHFNSAISNTEKIKIIFENNSEYFIRLSKNYYALTLPILNNAKNLGIKSAKEITTIDNLTNEIDFYTQYVDKLSENLRTVLSDSPPNFKFKYNSHAPRKVLEFYYLMHIFSWKPQKHAFIIDNIYNDSTYSYIEEYLNSVLSAKQLDILIIDKNSYNKKGGNLSMINFPLYLIIAVIIIFIIWFFWNQYNSYIIDKFINFSSYMA